LRAREPSGRGHGESGLTHEEVRLLLHLRQAGRRHVLSHDDRGHEVQDQEGRCALHRDAGERGNLHELL